MPATATRSKSTAKPKRAGTSNFNAPRWTDQEIKVLLDAVASSPTAKAGFENASKVLGKTVGTVQQKYYALKRKENGGRKRGRKPGRPAAKRTAPASNIPSKARPAAPSRKPSVDVS